MSKCQFCDHFNPDNVTTCAKCGAPLTAAIAAPTETSQQAEPAPTKPLPEPGSLEAEVLGLLRSQGKIAAIKLYRMKTDTTLLQAKNFVEQLATDHNVAPGSTAGCAGAALLMFVAIATAVYSAWT